jgi:CMP-N,N'-diacetyllegionaminic acid synthase
MIDGKSVLAIIPARGGSKGIPRKNLAILSGKPLIAWTIEEAMKSRHIDRLILSSDDTEIMAAGRQWGCDVPFQRPPELALDDTPGIEPILHAIEALPEKYDYVTVLQPTSPLRRVEDIDGCIQRCVNRNAPACVTVAPAAKSPYWMYLVDEKDYLTPVMREEHGAIRQNLPAVYVLNGAVYVAATAWLKDRQNFVSAETVAYIMPAERSQDIDTDIDLQWCRFRLDHQ